MTILTRPGGCRIRPISDSPYGFAAVIAQCGEAAVGRRSTLRMLLGLAAPTHGRALVFGRAFAELERPATRVGAVLAATDLHPGTHGARSRGALAHAARHPRSRVEEVLALVDLAGAAHRRVAGYSLGLRQRLGLAAAMLGDPALLILDEPASSEPWPPLAFVCLVTARRSRSCFSSINIRGVEVEP